MARPAVSSRSSKAPPTYTNRFGRRSGRGLRPWLLLPKVIAVAAWLGGLAAATLIAWHITPPAGKTAAAELVLIRRLLDELLRPALIAAVVLGVGLLLQHPRVFLKARWLQVKLAMIVLSLPACGILVSRSLTRLQNTPLPPEQWRLNLAVLRGALTAAVVASLLIVIVGRLKPRLGQRHSKSPTKRR